MINTCKTKIRILRKNDPNFLIKDDLVVSPRAGFEISLDCPDTYKYIIVECIQNGWIQPVAYIGEREFIFIGLNKN